MGCGLSWQARVAFLGAGRSGELAAQAGQELADGEAARGGGGRPAGWPRRRERGVQLREPASGLLPGPVHVRRGLHVGLLVGQGPVLLAGCPQSAGGPAKAGGGRRSTPILTPYLEAM